MNPKRRNAIQKRAKELLEEQGVTAAPVPVERIAKGLGYAVAVFAARR